MLMEAMRRSAEECEHGRYLSARSEYLGVRYRRKAAPPAPKMDDQLNGLEYCLGYHSTALKRNT